MKPSGLAERVEKPQAFQRTWNTMRGRRGSDFGNRFDHISSPLSSSFGCQNKLRDEVNGDGSDGLQMKQNKIVH